MSYLFDFVVNNSLRFCPETHTCLGNSAVIQKPKILLFQRTKRLAMDFEEWETYPCLVMVIGLCWDS
jgi:hypothetical protein